MVEQECGLNSSIEDYQAEFKFGLAEVVHRWALGTVRKLDKIKPHQLAFVFLAHYLLN